MSSAFLGFVITTYYLEDSESDEQRYDKLFNDLKTKHGDDIVHSNCKQMCCSGYCLTLIVGYNITGKSHKSICQLDIGRLEKIRDKYYKNFKINVVVP